MKMVVFLKQTIDTEEKIVLEDGKVKKDEVEFIINPYDEYAIEEALRIRDTVGGEITAITIGPATVEEALRKALAMGVNHAVHLQDEQMSGDAYQTATLLADYVNSNGPFDLLLGGYQSIDHGSGQVAVRISELLGIPHVSTVVQLELEGEKVTAHRDAEGDIEIVETRLPVLITTQQGLNEPRYPSLIGMRKAAKMEIHRIQVDEKFRNAAAKSQIVETYLPKPKSSGRMLVGETKEQVMELISLLRNSDKVI